MSILTKIFVVLVTVLSVLLVALVVPFVANTENFRGQLTQTQQKLAAAESKARLAQTEISTAQAGLSQTITNLQNEITALKEKNNTLQSDVDTARSARQAEAARLAQLDAAVTIMTATNEQNAKLIDALSSEVTQRRDAMVKLERQGIEQRDQINAMQSENEGLTRAFRRASENLAAREGELRDLQQRIALLPPDQKLALTGDQSAMSAGGVEPEGRVIQGKVTKVEDVDGTTFVQLNVGERDQVTPNMKFYVHTPGNELLGTVVITAVDVDAAAGRVTLKSGNGPITPGALVYTGRS